MDIRAAYDWSRVIDWLDSDITAYTIKHAIGFVIVWWLARRWLRASAAETAPALATTNLTSARAIASVMAPGCARARQIAAIGDADKGRRSDCPCATANANTVHADTQCVAWSA